MPEQRQPNGWFQRYTVESLDRLEGKVDDSNTKLSGLSDRILILETKNRIKASTWGAAGGLIASIIAGVSIALIAGVL